MKTAIIAAALVASILANAVSASANSYVDPAARFNGDKFFAAQRSGQ